ncbi:hypothetical protein [Dysgonomonas sp. 25]|uniref:hypothetical protein n=1 Tax=Dysgonomonas sp. 25 TaxID=2302933 RepID=UPI0013D6440E|nr:hypothetical protein [Dysgonomonas sp. 25]
MSGTDDNQGIKKPEQGRVNVGDRTPNQAVMTTEGYRLTEDKSGKFGAIYLDDCQFSPINGIRVEFEYVIHSASSSNGGADGFTFFVFDGSQTSITTGSGGASAGYMYTRANNKGKKNRCQGLTGGYLGVTFDVYGNFKDRRWSATDRKNGIKDYGNSQGKQNHITLRGAKGVAHPSINGMGDGYTGYPVLITQSTTNKSDNRRLKADGDYGSFSTSYNSSFQLRNGTGSGKYRKAIIELYPIAGNNGMYVTVKVIHGDTESTVINDYAYKTETAYFENAISNASSGDYNADDKINEGGAFKENLNTAPPAIMKMGFAASTGGKYDKHVIKNLSITFPCSAKAENDAAETTRGYAVSLLPLENDIAYTGPVSRMSVGSKEYIDPSTFCFVHPLTGQPSATPHQLNVAGQGNWVYDMHTKKVTFTPLYSFIGNAVVKYTIKGGLNNEMPYCDEAYRSQPASIRVSVSSAGHKLISNRMISSKLR